jgi:hypothetical protein
MPSESEFSHTVQLLIKKYNSQYLIAFTVFIL